MTSNRGFVRQDPEQTDKAGDEPGVPEQRRGGGVDEIEVRTPRANDPVHSNPLVDVRRGAAGHVAGMGGGEDLPGVPRREDGVGQLPVDRAAEMLFAVPAEHVEDSH